MIRYGRRPLLRLFPAFFPVWLCITATAVHGGTLPATLLADANLNDVFFIDDKIGWAVGDRGAVWQTDNGGDDWLRQPFPTSDRLTAVCFRDARNGWIGTSWTQPYLHTARGRIWRTDDGGKSWQRSKTDTLPAVQTLFFSDARHGWATTRQSTLHDSNLFQSLDGGRSWHAIHGTAAHRWVDTAWRSDGSGVCLASDGHVFLLPIDNRRQQSHSAAPLPIEAAGRLRAIAMAANRTLIAGTGGLLLATADNGRTWHDLRANLPSGLADEFDWLTMTSQGNDVWIAGDPGTTVLHSSDGGQTWSLRHTGQALPIRRLRFMNASQGWSVGSHGTILATRDAGISWQPQRMVADRVAVLGIYSGAADIDWELLTQLSVQEGYRSQVLLVEERSLPGSNGVCPGTSGATAIETRAHEAAIIAGSGGVTYLSLGGGHDTAITQRLARTLRTWRPDVVVTAGDSQHAKRLQGAIVAAIGQAAESTAYHAQLSLADLRSWQVRKALMREESFAPRGAPRGNGPVVAAAQLVLPLGQSLADVGAACRACIATGCDPPPSLVSYRSLLPGGNSRQIMTGVMSRRGSTSRRPALNTAVGNVRDLSILAQRRRMAEQLLTKHVAGGHKPDVLLGQLDELISGPGRGGTGPGRISAAEQEAAGDTVFRLSEMLAAHDQLVTAQALRELFLHRFKQHALRDVVVWRQLQAATSAELRWWQARRSAEQTRAIPASVRTSSTTRPIGNVAPAALIVGQDDRNNTDIPQLLQAASPMLASRPEVRWAVARVADKDVAQRIRQQATLDPEWRRRATAAAWLTKRTAQLPTIVWKCPRRPTPRLDGELDDETWQDASRITLHALGPGGENTTGSLAAAYDSRFLYLGVSCPKVAAVAYPTSTQTRQRDTNLSAFDRIALSIDTNQDAMSAWQLTIDSRGWANDSCLQHASWNPTWHIAVQPTGDSWTVETAIPLEELAAETTTAGAAWAVAVRRYTPGSGTQAWPTTVHATPTPQSFGLLLFE